MGGPGSFHGSHDTIVEVDATASAPPPTSEKPKDNAPLIERDENTSSSDEDEETHEMQRRHSIVRDLARQYTHSSQHFQGSHADLFAADDPNSPLNPQSNNFNARA
ncbi:hypothetical protein H9Q72_009371 [Fusarium xylarioides]|uniref:Uncharacterized protein n=1 Tax=Fusarium xylarioides TaxID=221167 RepID=A0A9P7HMW0_9HYPO|nr:hypothetical protein H9Q72_009371 [Fusarium xylarioides]KAG5807910.1 hypothetical protein H9Q71_007519 [Fusarium xylarioides]KAG5825585.1 hypothetical protein H9Q74_004318 [Fusarium xylarioides]